MDIKKTLESMADSAMVAHIYTDDFTNSPEGFLQMGASVIMDKPILVLAKKGTTISWKVRLVADRIVEFDNLEDSVEEIKEAITYVSGLANNKP